MESIPFIRSCLLLLTAHCSWLLSDPIIIGVAGGTASGKTTFTQKIRAIFPDDVVIITQDSYFKHFPDLSLEERMQLNWDCPDSVDFALLREHLLALKAQDSIEQPLRNFFTYSRDSFTKSVKPTSVIVVEGILIFADAEIRDLCDIKIYVEASDDVRLLRRINRDILERGANLQDLTMQYIKHIKPMHDRFVEPTKIYADIIIPQGGESQVSFDLIRDAIAHALGQQQ